MLAKIKLDENKAIHSSYAFKKTFTSLSAQLLTNKFVQKHVKTKLGNNYNWDGDISWTMTFRGHYFSIWATSRRHSQRVTFSWTLSVTSRGQF